ncbi:MurR/RpiR family transcriptional regulator [Lysinibacillus telephonicus]|uniref:MurR/RpiR family transcriptional regulator n=1 Tax=Lysinibacillus telephonicus TaxID=1714840 RepID=A0A431UWV5_9BACI|nr:MurR/RpiR family transcriptional regulator [Lysinibacillus telephonicus]RTQ95762.1 MurR/RpiR family transcriptional regulator [Lysinibacillus telephonicus]
MDNGLERIRQGIPILKPSEKKVSDYILNNPKDVLHMPIAQLSKATNTSEATIIRMCKALQFKGYRDLKLSIAAAIPQNKPIEHNYQEISAETSLSETIQQIVSNNIYSIKNITAVNDEEDLKKVIHALNTARKIIIIGVGASAIVALDFEQKLKRINKWCEALTDSHSQLVSVTNLNKEDVLFAISYSGETKEILNSVSIAKENNTKIISLTSYSNNTLQKTSTFTLFVTSTENTIRSAATASRISQLTLIDILYTGIASIHFDESVNYLEKTREVITRFSK